MSDKMKSALEIALEKASKIGEEVSSEAREMENRQLLTPILADYYKDKLSANELWQKLKEKGDKELWMEAQKLLIESIGIKTTERQLQKRKEGILAIESLKKEQNPAEIEQVLNEIINLVNKYEKQMESLEDRYNNEINESSEMKMRPVRTQDGKTVMQVQNEVDEKTKEHFARVRANMDEQARAKLNGLLEHLNDIIV